MDEQENVMIVETCTNRIRIFQQDGTLLACIPVQYPRCVCVDPYRRIYVGSREDFIQVFGFDASIVDNQG